MLDLIKDFEISSDLRENVAAFLIHHNCPVESKHSLDVGKLAGELAVRFNVDETIAQQAGWLHDISRVFPKNKWLEISKSLELDILPLEKEAPVLLHQKLSVVLAKEIFHIQDEGVLSAIGCHTTLKAGASPLDQVVFLADKLGWRPEGPRPYVDKLLADLEVSLDEAVWGFQNGLLHSGKIKTPHPWMHESYIELSKKLNKS